MDKDKQELERRVNSQKEQLTRYETRLKDVVAAYKGLLKEKEALESTVTALSNAQQINSNQIDTESGQSTSKSQPNEIATLMHSLATLSAEKSRQEQSFQMDKKQLRHELSAKDKQIKDLQEKLTIAVDDGREGVDRVKSQAIIDRDKRTNEHMVKIRDLQKQLADERHFNQNIEMQLNSLKREIATNGNQGPSYKSLQVELEQAQRKLRDYQHMETKENPSVILAQLKREMKTVQQHHAAALKMEQKRAADAEDQNRRLSATHEDRVVSLEAKLADLSATVGNYARLRIVDQENIFKLKEKLAELTERSSSSENDLSEMSVDRLVDRFLEIRQLLANRSDEIGSIDLPIHPSENSATDHTQCRDAIAKLQQVVDGQAVEFQNQQKIIEQQKQNIKTLQDKVKVLNRNIDEQEVELKTIREKHAHELAEQSVKWSRKLSDCSIEQKGKISELELQLQKQRDRSLNLLQEKEMEIKTLKTSFQLFIPNTRPEDNSDTMAEDPNNQQVVDVGQINKSSGKSVFKVGTEYHMLYYVEELARKDVEITALRKAKYSVECGLRQALQDKVLSQETMHERMHELNEQVDRLERCKSREGANLEYLKNVFFSFLISKNIEKRRHMVNAIGAVLKFNPAEHETISKLF